MNPLSAMTGQWCVHANAGRRLNVACLFCGKEKWEHEDDREYVLDAKHTVYSHEHYVRWMRRENIFLYVIFATALTMLTGGLAWLLF